MGIQTCAPQPFVGTQQFEVPFSTAILPVTSNGAPDPIITLNVVRRPSAHLWGVSFSSVRGAYDFAISTKGNEQAIIDIAVACYNASVNFVKDNTDNTLYPDQYLESAVGNFGDYLYRKVNADPCLLSRYIEVYNKTATFFRLHGAIGAYDLPLYKELQVQQNAIQAEIDKQMLIPPGAYKFYPGSIGQAALKAWIAADATMTGLYCLELVTN